MLNIAGETFKDKRDLLNFIHQLLQKSPINKILTDKAERVIGHLLTHHPEYKQKTEAGVNYLCIGIHKASGGRAYCVVTNDGKIDTFSIKKCVNAWEQHAPKQKNENSEKKENTRHQLSSQKPKQPISAPESSGNSSRPTVRQQIVALLSEGQRKREDIITHLYGTSPTASQKKYVGRQLSTLVLKGQVVRVKHGVYAPLNDTAENNTDMHQRIGRIAAQLAACQNELQSIQEQIQSEKQNEQ